MRSVCARPKPPPGHLRARTEAPEGATRYTPKLAIQELNSIASSRSFNGHQPLDPLAREVPESPARNAAEGAQGRNTTKASALLQCVPVFTARGVVFTPRPTPKV